MGAQAVLRKDLTIAGVDESSTGDKVALITGAGSGIGRESALLFAREGAAVVVVDVDDAAGRRPSSSVTAARAGARAICHADVSQAADCERMVAFAEEEFGKLDVLFNNAGIMHGEDDDAVTTDEAIWDLTMNINAKGVFLGCKYGIPALRRAGGGSIINTASFVALLGAATPQIAYTASKGAVLALTRELAVIHARENIRVNALCPGPLRTELLMELPRHRGEEAAASGAHPDGALRRGEGDRAGGAVPRLRRIVLRHRDRVPGRRRDHGRLRDAGVKNFLIRMLWGLVESR